MDEGEQAGWTSNQKRERRFITNLEVGEKWAVFFNNLWLGAEWAVFLSYWSEIGWWLLLHDISYSYYLDV